MFERQLAVLDTIIGRMTGVISRGMRAWQAALLTPLPQGLQTRLRLNGALSIKWPLTGEHTADSPAHNGPVAVDLASDLVFWTETTIPKGARWGAERAVALRMAQLSPIPPTDAVFSLGKPTSIGDDRLSVPIGITHRKTLADVETAFPDATPTVTATSPDAQSIVFDTAKNKDVDVKHLLLHPIASAGMVVIALVAGLQIWWDRETAHYHPLIREEASNIRSLETTTKDAETVIDSFRLISLSSMSERLKAAIPEGSIVEKIEITGGTVLLEGFIPSNGQPPSLANQGEFNRLRTQRPGWDQFSFRLRLEEDS